MRDYWLSRSLTALGIIGIVFGLAGAVFSFVSLQDRVRRMTFELRDGILHVEQAIGFVRNHEAVLTSSLNLLQSGADFLQQAPELFTALGRNALEVADTLEASSRMLRGVKKGLLAELAVADPDLKRAAAEAHELAIQLRLLDRKLREFARASRPLAGGANQLAARLLDLRSELQRSGAGLESLQSDLQQMREAIRSAELPRLAAGAGAFGGGLYVFLGLLALALGRIQRRWE